MIAPGAIVGDVDAFFAFGGGGHQRAVGVEDGLIEERVGLLFPDADADIVEDVLQNVDMVGMKAPAEIASGSRIGDATSTKGVQEIDVIAAQLDVLQAIAVAHGVVGDIEHVIGFEVRSVNFEE